MVITYEVGNILGTLSEVLINPVNTVGVMGAGLAKQIAATYPVMYLEYKRRCKKGEVTIGSMDIHMVANTLTASQFVWNFPTKKHWNEPSKVDYIEAGITNMCDLLELFHIPSVAIPKIGCGLGGLDWGIVKPLLINSLNSITSDLMVQIYE